MSKNAEFVLTCFLHFIGVAPFRHETGSPPKVLPTNFAHNLIFWNLFERLWRRQTWTNGNRYSRHLCWPLTKSSARISLRAIKRMDAQLSQTMQMGQQTSSMKNEPWCFSFAFPTSSCHCHPCHQLGDAGAFPQRCVGMSVRVETQDCVPTNAADPFADPCATSAARTACGRFVWRGLVGVTSGGLQVNALQSKQTQWKHWSVPLLMLPRLGKETEQGTCKWHRQRLLQPNKLWVHAVTHRGVWPRPILVWTRRMVPKQLYIYAVVSKVCPGFPFFWVKHLSIFPLFPFFFFKILLISVGSMRFFKKNNLKREDKELPFFWVNLFHIFGPFFPFSHMLKPHFLQGFQQKLHVCCPPQKIRNTICEHNCANWCFFVLFCCIFVVFFCCVRFWVFF